MLTVHEIADRSEVPAHVVRYYVRIGLIQPDDQQENGYRLFAHNKIGRIRFIRMAKNLGFTLNEIRQIISHADEGESPCGDVRRVIEHRIQENRAKIEAMEQLQTRMEKALEHWKEMPDGVPDGKSICHLIEAESAIEEDSSNHAAH
ncbi:MAG TPA: MerR family transcriptional regulator [Gammaproteobacteria bacterium]|nr:MerR family transcriptional regulator [Gammaproteobacteria bacterium]